MNLIHVLILAIVQGLAELLPVSSSAHVVVAEKLLGLKPSEPKMMLLLVMLHTGTMFAVVLYFWRAWKQSIFASRAVFVGQMIRLGTATILTAAVGLPLIFGIQKAFNSDIESLSDYLALVAIALAAAGLLILIAGLARRAGDSPNSRTGEYGPLTLSAAQVAAQDRPIGIREAAWIGGRPRAVSAVPGLFTLRRDNLHRPAAGRCQDQSRGIQLRTGRNHYPAGHRARGVAANQGRARSRGFGRDVELVRSQPSRHGLGFFGGPAGASMALALVGTRPLVVLRRVLPGGRIRRLRSPLPGLLTIS